MCSSVWLTKKCVFDLVSIKDVKGNLTRVSTWGGGLRMRMRVSLHQCRRARTRREKLGGDLVQVHERGLRSAKDCETIDGNFICGQSAHHCVKTQHLPGRSPPPKHHRHSKGSKKKTCEANLCHHTPRKRHQRVQGHGGLARTTIGLVPNRSDVRAGEEVHAGRCGHSKGEDCETQ